MGEFVPTAVTVRSPATSANLGPGFDAFGLALGMYDVVRAAVTRGGLEVDVDGIDSESVTRDESHLVVRAIRFTFDALDVAQPGLRLDSRNGIPHGRGLGSSASAIVSGITLADALLGGDAVTAELALTLATQLEGHPDNVAACLAGGFTIAWRGPGQSVGAARLDVLSDIRPTVFIPPQPLSTAVARALLPAQVPHVAASDNAGRAALLVAALTSNPAFLMAGTQDALHQEFRRPALPDSMALVDELRAAGIAAVVSGAGPTVLALATPGAPLDGTRWAPRGWVATDLPVSSRGVTRA